MKKSDYLKKIVDRLEDSFVQNGTSDDYTIYWDVEKVDGVKHPILTLEFEDGHEKEFDLFDAYTRHEEEDISMSDSFRSVKTEIYNYITAYTNELENEEPYDQEEEDEYGFEDEDSFEEKVANDLNRLYSFVFNTHDSSQDDIRSQLRIRLLNVNDPLCLNSPDIPYKTYGDIVVFPNISGEMDYTLFSGISSENIVDLAIENIQNNPDHIRCDYLGDRQETVLISSAEGMFSESVMNQVKDLFNGKEFYIAPASKNELVAIVKDALPVETVLNSLLRGNEMLERTTDADDPNFPILSNMVFEYDFENKIPVVVAGETREQASVHENDTPSESATQQAIRPSLDRSYQDHVRPSESTVHQEEQSSYEAPSNQDEEIHDSNYFAEYDTSSLNEFANTMVELFNYRLGNDFHLSGMDLVDNAGLVHLNMEEANQEYQSNYMDFLEYGDFLVDRYTELKEEALQNEDQEEDNLEESSESYPDDYLPFF